ncbi:MAG: amino acid racemase [Actinomycetia bacterium]|nr:amino acid racemase [Actinomycetes bacterium]
MALDGWHSPVVGVLGGLGPAATVSFLDQLVRFTDAATDQDNLDAIVLQHSSTPDRTQAILHGAPSPAPSLVADVKRLEAAGADFWVLTCNTAHFFLDDIAGAVGIPGVSIVQATAQAAVTRAAGGPIAVFATEGTTATGVYRHEIEQLGGVVSPIAPDVQAALTRIIYDQVKAGRPGDVGLLERCIADTLAAGAHVIALGCTELSVVYDAAGLDTRPELVDSLRCLALATIQRAGRRVRV